jgi:GT2 family glycosyltransferase
MNMLDVKKEPLLDIVMLVHDQAPWADLAIRAVEHHTKNPYRLIVVNMASEKPETLAMLLEVERRGHFVIHLAENRSFSHGCNVGAGLGSAPFICFLNDDAIVTEGWDTAMLQDASSKHVGLVGARSNYAAGAQGGAPFAGKNPPFLVFVCVALRRTVWDLVGQMDEVTFDGFSSEDLDYSWRVVKAGLELKLSTAYVLHAGSRTLPVDPRARMANDAIYNARLVEKWGKEWIADHSKMIGRVLVATYHAEEWTRVKFMGALMGLKRSDGVTFSFFNATRMPIHHARQAVADYATDQGFDWLVQLDDDAVFPEDVIRRLLSHGKEIVTALAYQRKPPHLPCIFEVGDDGMLGRPLEGIEGTGLRKVDVSGYHCSVLSTNVIKKMRKEGIRQYFGGFENKVGEDFAFSLNCKKVGIPIYCDTDLISGHIGAEIVVDGAYVQRFKAGQTG